MLARFDGGMFLVDRGVIVLKPRKPLFDWVNSIEADKIVFDQAQVIRDCAAFLTPRLMHDGAVREFLEQNFEMLFEQELAWWNDDEAKWPANRDFPTFLAWFDAEFHSVVVDIA